MRTSFPRLTTMALLTAFASLDSPTRSENCSEETILTTPDRKEDRVEVGRPDGVPTLTVHSPRGIGRATVRTSAPRWPDELRLRFALKGLESAKITHGKTTLQVSVLSHGKHRVLREIKMAANPPCSITDPKHTHWIDVRLLDDQGQPTTELPLTSGHFELSLPKAFLKANPPAPIRIEWIDFYRG